jgi:hypothetical protein
MNQFKTWTDTDKKAILRDFEKYIKRGIYFGLYESEGLANMLVQDQLCRFMKDHKANLLVEILSYDDFCKEKLRDPS